MMATTNNRRRMRLRLFAWATLTASSLLTAAVASAQSDEPRWAVVVLAHDSTALEHGREAALLASAALAASGEQVVSMDAERFALDEHLGSQLQTPPSELISRLDRTVAETIRHVANGRSAEALAAGEPVLAESAPFAAALGRVDESSTQLANLCLVLVRAHLDRGEETAAQQQLATCLRLVPDLAPNPHVHPPEVRALVGALRTTLAGGAGATLSVQTPGPDAQACAVRVNGRPMGRTPWSSEPLVPGAYQIQVECSERPGRIQGLDLSAGATELLRVSPRLAATLDTRSGAPAIVSVSVADPDGDTLRGDVGELGRALHVTRVLAVVATDHGIMLRAFAVGDEPLARGIGAAVVPEPMSEAASRQAVATVVDGGAGGPQRTATPGAAHGDDVLVPAVGGAIAALGLGALGVSWYLWTEVDARGQALNRAGSAAQLVPAQRAFDDAAVLVPITGAIGSLALTISLPMFLPDEGRNVPWWSLVIGAAGLGVSVVGIYFLATEGGCYGNALAPCSRRSPTWALGTLVLEHAAPLLALPLTYAIRTLLPEGSGASASVRLDGDGGELSIAGSF